MDWAWLKYFRTSKEKKNNDQNPGTGRLTWSDALRLMSKEGVGVGHFVLINAFGALGIWLPVIIAWYGDKAVYLPFLQGLAAGTWYTFSLALLTSGSAFVIREYRNSRTGDFRHLKLGVLLFAGIALFFQTVFVVTDSITPLTYQSVPLAWRWQFNLQISMLILSVVVAALLYGLERLDDMKPSPTEANVRQREARIGSRIEQIEQAAPPTGWTT